jgi:hypothetical protein
MFRITDQLLIDRKVLCRLLGDVSLSHIIRLEHMGILAKARVQVGPRVVRYDVKQVQEMIDKRRLF